VLLDRASEQLVALTPVVRNYRVREDRGNPLEESEYLDSAHFAKVGLMLLGPVSRRVSEILMPATILDFCIHGVTNLVHDLLSMREISERRRIVKPGPNAVDDRVERGKIRISALRLAGCRAKSK